MAKTLHSNAITFVDYTDSRKLEAYITSNLPTIQIYDTNNQTYSPDWSIANLVLTADIYLDSKDVTDNTETTIEWLLKDEAGIESLLSSGQSLTITGNDVMSNNTGIITYVCKAQYQGIVARKEITFTRINTGTNGQDGTSVAIRGSYDTLEALKEAHPIGEVGDAYLINGDMYVWCVDDSSWANVGNIQGPKGDPGSSAALVTINPSSLYFKSTTGKDGTFTPNFIYLYPRFQNTSYKSWQYSLNSSTWIDVTETNGLTVDTYSSVPNALRISKDSTLYTDTVTSISFRCNSVDSTVYDVVSIIKIYDIVDLQIGGRNLLTNSGYMKTLDGWQNYSVTTPVQDLALENNDIYGSVLTATGTNESSRIRVGGYIPYLQKTNRTLTFSMVYSASEDASTVVMGGKYSAFDNTGEYNQFNGGTVKRIDLGNGFTYMECPVNLTYREDTRSFFVYIYPKVQTIKIVWCKLEEGNKATDWIPAPEDYQNIILSETEELKQRVAQLEKTIEALLKEKQS